MNSRLAFTLCAVLLFPAVSAGAQEPGEARVWLTTPDRSQLLTLQKEPLHFSASANTLPTIDVNDDQQYQPIDGFGFALTGGSAQLLLLRGVHC
jgi:glucosylceramidase